MITKIDPKTAYRLLKDRNDVFTLKIYADLKSYENYDFFKVYAGKGVLIGQYYDSLTIRAKGLISDDEYEELSLFLKVCGCSAAQCALETGTRLLLPAGARTEENMLFKFSGALIPDEELNEIPDLEKIKVDPPLDEVYEIMRYAFPKLDSEQGKSEWYTDMSHRIRHGTAKIYLYEGATVTKFAEYNNAALLTHVASGESARGKGSAKKLLRTVGKELEKRGVEPMIICKKELAGFYKKAGFYEQAKVMTIYN